jgi:hypothetical protein
MLFSQAVRVSLIAALLGLATACAGGGTCGPEDPSASPNVAGTYRYASSRGFALTGTIVFAQTGRQVQVLETTYDNADDRSLMGAATLAGNRLDITLTPVNGDTDYDASVGFLFDEAAGSFCVTGFTDSNGDVGGAASYHGARQ